MKTFRVVMISSNTNAFGLNQVVFLSTGEDREAFRACICLLSPPSNAIAYGRGTLHAFNVEDFPTHIPFELPEALPPCPPEFFAELHRRALTKAPTSPTLPANPNE